MTAGELVLIVLAVLMILGFTALIVVLLRVLDTLRSLRSEVTELRDETRPLLADLRHTTNEARSTVELTDRYIILPPYHRDEQYGGGATPVPDGFCYASNTNKVSLTLKDMRALIAEIGST